MPGEATVETEVNKVDALSFLCDETLNKIDPAFTFVVGDMTAACGQDAP